MCVSVFDDSGHGVRGHGSLDRLWQLTPVQQLERGSPGLAVLKIEFPLEQAFVILNTLMLPVSLCKYLHFIALRTFFSFVISDTLMRSFHSACRFTMSD